MNMTTQPENFGFDGDRLHRISSWMDSYISERKFAGSSILIKRGGQDVFFNATGQRSIEESLPFERDTVVRIYSMTKPITSTAIMMLVEQGLFHLDAPISEFVPAFASMSALVPGAERIDQTTPCTTPTLHQLLTHTSGLSYAFNPGPLPLEMNDRKIFFAPRQGLLADMVNQVADLPLAFEPGARWEYSVAIDVIGRVIEIVSGQSLDAFLDEHILGPLGMSQTGFSVRADTGNRFASLYTPLPGDPMALNAASSGGETLRLTDRPGASPFEKTTLFSGGGGLVGSIDDYMAFVEMLRSGGSTKTGRLLSPRTVDFMLRNHLPGDIASMGPQSFAEQPMEGMGFGLGGALTLNPALTRCAGTSGDFSWGGMASTFFSLDREQDMSVVFFTQLSPSSSYPNRAQLKALVHGAMTS